MGFRGVIVLVAVAACAVAATPAFADERRVVNPGPVEIASVPEGLFHGMTDVDARGNFWVENGNSIWPVAATLSPRLGGANEITSWHLQALQAGRGSGTVTPVTGAMSFAMPVRFKAIGSATVLGISFNFNCTLGSADAPIELTLFSWDSPIVRVDPATGTRYQNTGTPYNQQTGRALLIDDTFVPPGISSPADCALSGHFLVSSIADVAVPYLSSELDVPEGETLVSLPLQLDPTVKAPVQIGTARMDAMTGTAYAETIRALGGNDTVIPLGGKDRVESGAGNDTVRAQDRVRDVVDCGSGRDIVYADKGDAVAQNCETVRRR